MIHRASIVGILNITPNSFSGDGILKDPTYSVEKIWKSCVESGADIIDIGAESTAPGAESINAQEEIQRLTPFFAYRAQNTFTQKLPLSLDTRNAKTAQFGIEQGVSFINDVSGGRNDPDMYSLIADSNIKYIMMYAKNTSGKADLVPSTDPVLERIYRFFDEYIPKALQAGIQKEQLIIDPGMGAFISTTPQDSLEVIERIEDIKKKYSLPLFIGFSRKKFLDAFISEGKEKTLAEREQVALKLSLLAQKNGADFIRTHTPKETKEYLSLR